MTLAPPNLAPPNKELERAIFKDRDDAQAWQVFGDWLSAQGDPRGEAIALSFAGKHVALEELIATHEKRWLGALYESVVKSRSHGDAPLKPATTIEWKHGFMHHARLADSADEELGGEHRSRKHLSCEDKVKALLALPSARFLHSLTIGVYFADKHNDYRGLEELLSASSLPMLRELFVGDFAEEEADLEESELWKSRRFLQQFPDLHSLRLRGSVLLDPFEHASLRSLEVETDGNAKNSTSIGSAALPKLESLALSSSSVSNHYYYCHGLVNDFASVFSGVTCPKLKHLRLTCMEDADLILAALAESALLPQLETLDLTMGLVTPRGARTLIKKKDAFAHLAKLDLRHGCLAPEVVEDLKREVSVAGEFLLDEQVAEISYEVYDQVAETIAGTEWSLLEALYEEGVLYYESVDE